MQQKYIDKLEQQLDEKDRQIAKLQEQNKDSQKLIDQEQQLHLVDQERIKKIENPEKQGKSNYKVEKNDKQQEQPKKSFFERLFGK